MKTKIINKEVLYANEHIIKLSYQDIKRLKDQMSLNKSNRIRLCVHKDIKDLIHEMFIVHTRNTYVRPHKHLNKVESLHIIEGAADAVIFDKKGNVLKVIQMGDYSSKERFYYRISDPYYHTLVINSDFLVFHEITKGPFKKSGTVFAPWAPDANNKVDCKEFMKKLFDKIKKFRRR